MYASYFDLFWKMGFSGFRYFGSFSGVWQFTVYFGIRRCENQVFPCWAVVLAGFWWLFAWVRESGESVVLHMMLTAKGLSSMNDSNATKKFDWTAKHTSSDSKKRMAGYFQIFRKSKSTFIGRTVRNLLFFLIFKPFQYSFIFSLIYLRSQFVV